MVEQGNCDAELDWQNRIWPRLIAVDLNAEYKNLAISMSSNHRIVRTTVEQLAIDTPDILIIGWTNMARVELPLANGDWARLGPNGCCSEKSDPVEAHNQYYYLKNYNEWLSFSQTILGMFMLTNLCELYKIKLYFFNSIFHNFLTNYQSIQTKNFFNLKTHSFLYREQVKQDLQLADSMLQKILNQNWLLEPSNILVDVCRKQNWATDQFGHPTIEYQQNIADMFLEKIGS